MFKKGFGQSQPTKIEKLIERMVQYACNRSPESLDRVFDNLPVKLNSQVLDGAIATLEKDTGTLAWLCGYFAGEINISEDNNKSHNPITLLSHLLIKYGMKPFVDFMPYTGCRISVINVDKFEALPTRICEVIKEACNLTEISVQEAQRINDALLQEMEVIEN